MNLFDDFIENGLRIIIFLANEDISNTLSDKLKRFAIIFVFVESSCVIFEIELRLSCLFLYLFEQKINISVGSLLDLSGDIDVGDKRP
jgi:hypothetical protein